jgi:hypothetical protein
LPRAAELASGFGNAAVMMSEVSGVRRMRFEAYGTVTDLGLTDFGSGYENMPGANGVQP